MVQVELHKQFLTDEVQLLVWHDAEAQGLPEIPALLSVWAGKNHVKPVLDSASSCTSLIWMRSW